MLSHQQQLTEELHSITTSSTTLSNNNNINNNNNHHHDAQQNILIIDDAPSRNDSCFNFLKSKLLFRRLYHPLPFSTRFEKKDTIKKQFLLPYDVKLSHLNQCIIVSDSENESLRILDLESGEEKCTIKIGHVTRYLAIEMDKKKEKEYLYLSVESGFLYKFDLAELISDGIEGKPLRFVWRLGETNDEELELELPSCIAVSYSDKYKTENYQDENAIILVCDTGKNKLLMLASSDGSLIDSVSTFVPGHLVEEDDDYVDEDLQTSFKQPFGICLDHNEDIIISEHHAGMRANIHLLEKAGECFVTKKSLYTSFPTYVMFEPVRRYIFISEEGESMINIIDYEGNSVKRIKTFKDVGEEEGEATFEIPDGMCINDKTGELYLVDCEKNQLLIFE